MANTSRIEWTQQTWNPTTGCTKISPGCKHCYAEVMAGRLQAMGAKGYEHGFALALHPDRLWRSMFAHRPHAIYRGLMAWASPKHSIAHDRPPSGFRMRTAPNPLSTRRTLLQMSPKRFSSSRSIFGFLEAKDVR